MLSLLSEIKFLTLQEELSVKDVDYGSFKFYEKKELSDYNKSFFEAKREYALRRGLIWIPTDKQPAKLKASLKHLDEELKCKKVVYCAWNSETSFNLLLASGLLVWIKIDLISGDIKEINFDKYFIGKLISENICDVIIARQYIIISYDDNQITYVYLSKASLKNSSLKISSADPKIFQIIIGGGQTKKINRNLVANMSSDLIAIWTKSSQNEFFPWRPSVKDQERANLHIYKLNRIKFEPVCYYWTENNPIGFEFSKFNENEMRSVEQKISRKGEVTVESCTYHISNSKSKLQRVSVTSIPLQTEICCCTFSPDNEKIIMGCIDGSIVLFDETRGTTYLVKSSFIPSTIAFHPDSALFVIANERGQLQCFDISLSCVKNQLLSEDLGPSNLLDLSGYFLQPLSLSKICWSKKADINAYSNKYAHVDCFLLLLFNGALALTRFVGGSGLKNDMHTSGLSMDVIIHMYLSLNQVEKAINVLLSLNWDTYGAMCLLSLHKIANYIFKLPATPDREELLEKALASFHIPIKPLCNETEIEFGDNVDDITRRFFYYLIRFKSFEKAYRLAIDINDKDLFIILHKCSKAYGFVEISNEAYKCAEKIYEKEEEENNSHHSTCSISSCSICMSSTESCGSENYESAAESKTYGDLKKQAQINVSEKTNSSTSHPPLPSTHLYKFKEKSWLKAPPLPFDKNNENGNNLKKKATILSRSTMKCELTLQNLQKFNSTSSSVLPNQSLTNVTLNLKEDIDQTIGIPTTMNVTKDDDGDDDDYLVTTTIHNYPLISGSIPSLSYTGMQNKLNFSTQFIKSPPSFKKDSSLPVNSILTNTNLPTSSSLRKEGGEKNKVKFSNTITVAVMPELPLINERLKRKTIFPNMVDPIRKELANSLPLSHPNQDYLKDFMPAADMEEKNSKPSIKVVNLGVL